MVTKALKSYPIKGGKLGRNRLSVIARVLEPTTEALFKRAGMPKGAQVIDAGCGGGDVTFALARFVGPEGHVTGIDLDEEKLALARSEAQAHGIGNVRFEAGDVVGQWPVGNADVVYVRFILTHLADPKALLRQVRAALKPGGVMVVEDIDIAGYFCYPDCPALMTYLERYMALSRRRGGDPLIGRRLSLLMEEAGFDKVDMIMVQPFSRMGGAKEVSLLTLAATGDALVTEKLVSNEELLHLKQELESFIRRPDTIVSMPRIFQAWGRNSMTGPA